ncbi:MAG: hypothetical protein JWM47_4501, partial [Acidimicrobiales bacterium]|nr:hypothetical protein [Acidimicrobiales bacterium]
ELNPLRETLRLAEHEYQEGVFCWKGFLYYKWTLGQTLPGAKWVSEQLATIKPTGHIDKDWADYLERTKSSIRKAISDNCESIKNTIKVYDDAYVNLTYNGKPMAFREFLLDAPKLFASLGERLSTLNHIHHFWKFRFPLRVPAPITMEDFIGILVDLEISLNCEEPGHKKPDQPSGAGSRTSQRQAVQARL